MQLLALSGLLILLSSNAYAQVLYDDVIYAQGTQVKASKSDTVISRDALRVYEKDRPNALIHGYVTASGLDRNNLQFLLIRCVVKTGRESLRRILARLVVEYYDAEYFSYWQLDTFNIAITDTIPSNETRTYLFKQYLDVMNNTGSQMLWNYYRQSSNPELFRWTFETVFVRRIN